MLNGETYDPGETYKAYDFFLSPDKQWLFVIRGLAYQETASYLYKRSGPHCMSLISPHGRRFDDAALNALERNRTLVNRNLGYFANLMRFVSWQSGKLYFDYGVANYWYSDARDKDDLGLVWTGDFDLKRNSFKVIAVRGLKDS